MFVLSCIVRTCASYHFILDERLMLKAQAWLLNLDWNWTMDYDFAP
jgi:hypothetical protein